MPLVKEKSFHFEDDRDYDSDYHPDAIPIARIGMQGRSQVY